MKPVILNIAAAFVLFSVSPSFAEDPLGTWQTPKGRSHVAIVACGSKLCSKVVWIEKPYKDARNADRSKRHRPILGIAILTALKKQRGADVWKGKVYNPEDGRTYPARVRLASPSTLVVKGCILGGAICRSQNWTRVY